MIVPLSLVINLLAVVIVRVFETRATPVVWELFSTAVRPSVWLALIVVVGHLISWRWYKADQYQLTSRVFAILATLLYFSLILSIVVYRISSIPASAYT